MEKEIIIIPEQIEQQVEIKSEPFLLTKTQDKTVSLDMSDGDQIIRPDGDSLLQSVTIEKPDTFIPENIKKDVEIGGVTGEYEIVLPTLDNPANDNDVIQGKEYLDGEGQKQTGDFVPPVDTGANGLYKMIVQGEQLPAVVEDEGITEINSANRTYVIDIRGVRKLRLPNCNTLGNLRIFYANNALKIIELGSELEIFTSSSAGVGQGFITFSNVPDELKFVGIKRLGSYSAMGLAKIKHFWFTDLSRVSDYALYINAGFITQTATFDNLLTLDGRAFFGTRPNNTLAAVIIRTPTMCTLTAVFTSSDVSNGLTKLYVPANLLTQYASATNWTTYYNRGQIIGIDEDTTATVGTTFTPTTTATDIVSWDMVELQSYSVGTVDTATGAITPTHDGRLLIRGLDANGNIKHVTYLQIGTGFDEEANLA